MSRRLSRGRSTPAIRAIRSCSLVLGLALALLVPWVRADHEDRAPAPDDAAPVADPLDARSNLHLPIPQALLVAVHHTASGEVVRRQFHQHPVTREDADVV